MPYLKPLMGLPIAAENVHLGICAAVAVEVAPVVPSKYSKGTEPVEHSNDPA